MRWFSEHVVKYIWMKSMLRKVNVRSTAVYNGTLPPIIGACLLILLWDVVILMYKSKRQGKKHSFSFFFCGSGEQQPNGGLEKEQLLYNEKALISDKVWYPHTSWYTYRYIFCSILWSWFLIHIWYGKYSDNAWYPLTPGNCNIIYNNIII